MIILKTSLINTANRTSRSPFTNESEK